MIYKVYFIFYPAIIAGYFFMFFGTGFIFNIQKIEYNNIYIFHITNINWDLYWKMLYILWYKITLKKP